MESLIKKLYQTCGSIEDCHWQNLSSEFRCWLFSRCSANERMTLMTPRRWFCSVAALRCIQTTIAMQTSASNQEKFEGVSSAAGNVVFLTSPASALSCLSLCFFPSIFLYFVYDSYNKYIRRLFNYSDYSPASALSISWSANDIAVWENRSAPLPTVLELYPGRWKRRTGKWRT